MSNETLDRLLITPAVRAPRIRACLLVEPEISSIRRRDSAAALWLTGYPVDELAQGSEGAVERCPAVYLACLRVDPLPQHSGKGAGLLEMEPADRSEAVEGLKLVNGSERMVVLVEEGVRHSSGTSVYSDRQLVPRVGASRYLRLRKLRPGIKAETSKAGNPSCWP